MDKIKITIKVMLLLVVYSAICGLFLYDPLVSLGKGYLYDIDRHNISGSEIDIPPCVEKVDFNFSYIIAKQKPERFDDAIYEKRYYYPVGRDTTYYWLIYKKDHRFVGPVLYDELIKVLKEDNINIHIKDKESGVWFDTGVCSLSVD